MLFRNLVTGFRKEKFTKDHLKTQLINNKQFTRFTKMFL